MAVGGVQSFCILEGATDPLIDQWLNFFVNQAQTYDEQMLEISRQYFGLNKSFDQITENSVKQMAYLQ